MLLDAIFAAMRNSFRKTLYEFFHSLMLRLPQRIALRNGMRVTTYGKTSNSLFWSMFTSAEYLSFVPYLLRLQKKPALLIDCGAALGYFSLLTEHLIRSKVLTWNSLQYILIEPMRDNFKKLQFNVSGNLQACRLKKGLIGRKEGSEKFYSNRFLPWSGTIHSRSRLNKIDEISYVDLTEELSKNLCILKIDIEGSEYNFLENYQRDLKNVLAIIIEWHLEYGDPKGGISTLHANGFVTIHQSLNKNNRIVELFVNKEHYSA